MKRATTLAAIGMAGLLLAGCQTSIGGLGSTPRDILAGGLSSGAIGSGLTSSDRRNAAEAEFRALEYGRTGTIVPWQDKRSGHRGEVVPGTGYKINNSDCRDYTHTIYDDGQPKSGRGTACRQPDGTWKAVD
jgi:surface antigen